MKPAKDCVMIYYVVNRKGRNDGIIVTYGPWEQRIITARGWGFEIARRPMDAEEIEVFNSQKRYGFIRYETLEGLLEDEARVLDKDKLESLTKKLTTHHRIQEYAKTHQKNSESSHRIRVAGGKRARTSLGPDID